MVNWSQFLTGTGQIASAAIPASILGTAALGQVFGGRIAALLTSHALGPIGQNAEYIANLAVPSTIPTPNVTIELWHAGLIDRDLCERWMRAHGISWGDPAFEQETWLPPTKGWSRWTELTKSMPGIGEAIKWKRQGRLTEFDVDSLLNYKGFAQGPFKNLYLHDWENLPPGVITTVYGLGGIARGEAIAALLRLGFREDDAERILNSSITPTSVVGLLDQFNRGVIPLDAVRAGMFATGIRDQARQDRTLIQRFQLPLTGDIITSGARNAWSDATADRWGLDAEIPAEVEAWMQKIAMDARADGVQEVSPREGTNRLWHLLWRNHWQLPGLGMLAELRHRFRGDPARPETWSVPGFDPINELTISDCYRASGIPPALRRYMDVIAFPPMSVRHLRMVYTGLRKDDAWLNGKLLDLGLSTDNAADVAGAMKAARDAQDAAPVTNHQRGVWKRYLAAVVRAYKSGSMDFNAAIDALVKQGINPDVARLELTTAEIENLDALIGRVIKRAKSDVFNGRTSWQEAQTRLQNAGVTPQYAALLIRTWQAELGEGRKVLSTEKTLRLLRKGFIGGDEALRRLDNLGWAKPDELLMLAEVQAGIDQDQAKQLAAAARSSAAEVKEIERIVGKVGTYYGKLTGRLRQLTPVAEVMEWYKGGVHDLAWTETRLAIMGYDPETIAARIAEADLQASGQGTTPGTQTSKREANLRKLYPLAKMATWYKEGTRNWAWIEQRLIQQGYTEDSRAAIKDGWDKNTSNQSGQQPLLPGE